MYAVIKTGGKQYRVQEGDVITVERLNAEVGSEISFSDVLMFAGNDGVKVGSPVVDGAEVKAKVLEHGKNDKILIFKYKSKKNYRKRQGHRQPNTKVEILKING